MPFVVYMIWPNTLPIKLDFFKRTAALKYLMLKRDTKGLIKKCAYVFKGDCV